ncbi:MAG: pyridoxamine 5'-phosphate oxidase [Thermomicrobia bacterium]|nr:pyridoxamine 5'-phosphate oxidase [Thermomicrobia bacterium]
MSDATDIGHAVAALRQEYAGMSLDEGDVDADPVTQFTRWFEQALAAHVPEPNAMTVATATRAGVPSARIVLLKGFDVRGFVFYTNYESRKGSELADNPVAALVFHWVELHRQVRITGAVEKVSHEESDAYFQSRPRGSRLGAWTSQQSSILDGRAPLEARLAELTAQFGEGNIPLPPFWGGYRVIPDTVEFWQGRLSRLHDRLRYARQPDTTWRIERLSP